VTVCTNRLVAVPNPWLPLVFRVRRALLLQSQ
jgi:hypothetical protein